MWSLFKVSLRYLEDTILIKIQERHQWQLHTLLWYFYYWLWTSKWRSRTLSHFFCIYHNKSFLTLVVIFQKNLFTSECIIAGKFPNTEFFSGLYLLVFGVNTEIYSVNLCLQSKYVKIRIRKNSVIGHLLHSVILQQHFCRGPFMLRFS